MIFSKFKESLLKDLPTLGAILIDGDYYSPNDRQENMRDVRPEAILGEPQPLENVTFDYGVLRADPIEFDPIQGKVPDYILVFTSAGSLVCCIDQLDWSERKIDGRKLLVSFPSTGIFQL